MLTATCLMHAARRKAHRIVGTVVALLMLQAALPMVAAFSARAQGVATAEVCSIYGVRTFAVDDQGRLVDTSTQVALAGHEASACALAQGLAGAPGVTSRVVTAAPAEVHAPWVPRRPWAPPRKPERDWAALLTHAPPVRI